MRGVGPWESSPELSRNKLDYLNKIRQEVSVQGKNFLTCNLTGYINIVQERTYLLHYKNWI